jgi:hypothetical protein
LVTTSQKWALFCLEIVSYITSNVTLLRNSFTVNNIHSHSFGKRELRVLQKGKNRINFATETKRILNRFGTHQSSSQSIHLKTEIDQIQKS